MRQHQLPSLSFRRVKEAAQKEGKGAGPEQARQGPGFDADAWRQQGRATIRQALNYNPPAVPFNLQVHETVQRNGYVRRRISFSTTPYTRVPAYLLVPTQGKGPYPAVLALHDHGGFFYYGKEKLVDVPGVHAALTQFKERCYAGRSVADELAQRGYVVLVIDAFYWGERRLQFEAPNAELSRRLEGLDPEAPEYVLAINRLAGERTRSLNTMLAFCGTNWLGILVHDDVRSLDLLAERPEVDPNRLGVVGLSIGGYRTTYLAGLDPRVKAACIVGWMTTLATCGAIRHPVHADIPMADGLHASLDHPDIASLAAPDCALLVQQCAQDQLFTWEGMTAAVESLARVYTELGRPDKFRAEFYDAPHQFNAEMQEAAFRWFARWL